MKQEQSKTSGRPERKRYAPPRILSRERLEAVAFVCVGPASKTAGACSMTINS